MYGEKDICWASVFVFFCNALVERISVGQHTEEVLGALCFDGGNADSYINSAYGYADGDGIADSDCDFDRADSNTIDNGDADEITNPNQDEDSNSYKDDDSEADENGDSDTNRDSNNYTYPNCNSNFDSDSNYYSFGNFDTNSNGNEYSIRRNHEKAIWLDNAFVRRACMGDLVLDRGDRCFRSRRSDGCFYQGNLGFPIGGNHWSWAE